MPSTTAARPSTRELRRIALHAAQTAGLPLTEAFRPCAEASPSSASPAVAGPAAGSPTAARPAADPSRSEMGVRAKTNSHDLVSF